jgi:ribosomal-protein-alanine N-acetyltransferase
VIGLGSSAPTPPLHCASSLAAYAYPPPYDLYDAAPGSAAMFADPVLAYFSVIDSDAALGGFGCVGAEARVPGGGEGAAGSLAQRFIDLGVGMAPGRVGQGFGRPFCAAALAHAVAAHGADRCALAPRVSVAAFNLRSLRIWEALGFLKEVRFEHARSGMLFVSLVRAPELPLPS